MERNEYDDRNSNAEKEVDGKGVDVPPTIPLLDNSQTAGGLQYGSAPSGQPIPFTNLHQQEKGSLGGSKTSLRSRVSRTAAEQDGVRKPSVDEEQEVVKDDLKQAV